MEFRKFLVMRGPNIWARFPVLEAWLDLDSMEGTLLGAITQLASTLAGLAGKGQTTETISREVGGSTCGGDLDGLRIAAGLCGAASSLQQLAGVKADFAKAVPTKQRSLFRVMFEYADEAVARGCLESARALCLEAIEGREPAIEATVLRLRGLNHDTRFGPSTGSIVAAALRRGIPVRRLNKDSLVQLGWGNLAKRISTAETSQTGAIAELIAQDKDLTRDLLRQVGVPVPDGRPVADANDAWAAAEELGLPVVVKPRFGNHGRGVTTNLATREGVRHAYQLANASTDDIVVEQFAPGDDYRLLVVGSRLVAAARRDPAQVVGDGLRTIAELIELVNLDPRRGEDHATSLTRISLDAFALATLSEQGHSPETVPQEGERVLIRRNANLSTGGTATDVTDLVHPEVAARAVEAAAVIGLDVAGIDVVATDITRPMEEQRAVVVEVNAGPGLRMHLEPSSGQARPVGEAIIDGLFVPGDDGRVPVVSVTGVNGKTTVTRLVTQLLTRSGRRVGMTCTDGIYIEGRRIESGDCAGPRSARAVLLNPRVEAAVLETARGGILREGLGFDLCDVGIVTNIGEGDHLGLHEIETLEQLARVKRTVVESVAPWGTAVLKADDPLVAGMAPYCQGTVTFFSTNPADEVIAAHRASGGRAVVLREGVATLVEGSRETGLLEIADAPLTLQGRARFQIENVLAGIAAAWALEVPEDVLIEAIRSFSSDAKTTPGRFNVYQHGGARIVVDYAHNASAFTALAQAVTQLPHERRSILFTAAGDRRDEDIERQGLLVANLFDRLMIYEGACNRDRPDGEVVALLRRGISQAAKPPEVWETRGEAQAVAAVLSQLEPGELLVIQADDVDQTLAQVHAHLADRPVTIIEPPHARRRLRPVSAAYPD